MTLLEQSEGSRVVFSMPPILSHVNLQFTLEETNSEGNLPFLDMNINRSWGRGVTCSWYQKPTDTGTILNYRSSAQLGISVVLSKALYTGLLGVHLAGSNVIRLWKLIGRNGSQIGALKISPQRLQTSCAKSSRVRASPWIVRAVCQLNHQRM